MGSLEVTDWSGSVLKSLVSQKSLMPKNRFDLLGNQFPVKMRCSWCKLRCSV